MAKRTTSVAEKGLLWPQKWLLRSHSAKTCLQNTVTNNREGRDQCFLLSWAANWHEQIEDFSRRQASCIAWASIVHSMLCCILVSTSRIIGRPKPSFTKTLVNTLLKKSDGLEDCLAEKDWNRKWKVRTAATDLLWVRFNYFLLFFLARSFRDHRSPWLPSVNHG